MTLICDAFAAAGLKVPAPQVISNSVTLRVRLVETGRFLAILPDSTIRFGAGRMQIKILPVPLTMKTPPTVAISLKHRTPNPAARLFIDELRAFAKPFMNGRPPQAAIQPTAKTSNGAGVAKR
jgi:DNA-binding transcriptional LysR family regulator